MAFLSLHVNSINIKGGFLNKLSIKYCTYPHVLIFFCSLILFISVILVLLSGDIETNPGPDRGYLSSFYFCHGNLKSITAHKFVKITLLQAYKACLVSIYRAPSQSSNEYDTFLLNFEQLLTYLNSIKPHVLLVGCDFNGRSSS